MVLDSSWLWQTAVGFKVMKYSQNLALINDQWSYPIENHAKASLNQGLRKCQAQLSTKTYTWFFRSILVFMRQVGKFSLLRFSLKSFKSKFWWQLDAIRTIADVRLIISENICCCRQLQNPRGDLLSWGQEGSYSIDRRRTIMYSNISYQRILLWWLNIGAGTFDVNNFRPSSVV